MRIRIYHTNIAVSSKRTAFSYSIQCWEDPDPYVFWPSGSAIILYGSGSLHRQAKKVRKTLIYTIFGFLFVFVSSKSNKQRTF